MKPEDRIWLRMEIAKAQKDKLPLVTIPTDVAAQLLTEHMRLSMLLRFVREDLAGISASVTRRLVELDGMMAEAKAEVTQEVPDVPPA